MSPPRSRSSTSSLRRPSGARLDARGGGEPARPLRAPPPPPPRLGALRRRPARAAARLSPIPDAATSARTSSRSSPHRAAPTAASSALASSEAAAAASADRNARRGVSSAAGADAGRSLPSSFTGEVSRDMDVASVRARLAAARRAVASSSRRRRGRAPAPPRRRFASLVRHRLSRTFVDPGPLKLRARLECRLLQRLRSGSAPRCSTSSTASRTGGIPMHAPAPGVASHSPASTSPPPCARRAARTASACDGAAARSSPRRRPGQRRRRDRRQGASADRRRPAPPAHELRLRPTCGRAGGRPRASRGPAAFTFAAAAAGVSRFPTPSPDTKLPEASGGLRLDLLTETAYGSAVFGREPAVEGREPVAARWAAANVGSSASCQDARISKSAPDAAGGAAARVP